MEEYSFAKSTDVDISVHVRMFVVLRDSYDGRLLTPGTELAWMALMIHHLCPLSSNDRT